MTIDTRRQAWHRPLPQPDPVVSRSFWSAAAEGRLLIQRCPGCGHRQFYRMLCVECGGTPDWFEACGQGTIYTFTVIRQNGAPGFADKIPYVVAMVALAEGPRMMGNVIGCPVDDVHIGMPVRAFAVEVEPSIAIVQSEPAGQLSLGGRISRPGHPGTA
jgi:uncharacterized protein